MEYFFRFTILLFWALCSTFAVGQESDNDLWNAINSSGHVVLMRHSTAPGTGDPRNFRLGDCSTQRNLSSGGRDQAKRIGDLFRAHGIATAMVYSSPWCRCVDTAEFLNLGEVQELAFIGSFYQRYQDQSRTEKTAALRQWLGEQSLDQPTVLVSHQVNITALTGVYPAEGEMVVLNVLEGGELKVIGSIKP